MTDTIKPEKLKIGDTIGIVAPARYCDSNLLLKVKENLLEKGFSVVEADNLQQRHGYLAGADSLRARALMKLFMEKDVKALWCVSGGYGSTRLLDLLDFNVIKQNPKIFIGFSDITGLHIPINTLCQMVTFLGPPLGVLYGDAYKESAKSIEKTCFDFLLNHDQKSFDLSQREDFKVLKEGIGKGKLLGGNLALICSLVGTKYSLKPQGSILIIEDINEPPYKIDRMLNQLKQAHLLDNINGVILASFKNCEPQTTNSLSLFQIFEEHFADLQCPIVYGMASGHIHHMVTLPLGVEVELNTFSKTLEIKESCFKAI